MPDFYNKYPYTDFHELNLDWVIERVKKLTEDWLATQTEWNDTKEQWQQLHDYVMDYFANLDVQDEINAKINSMILDGTFMTIVQPTIEQTVIDSTTTWLAAHITQPTTPVVDTSLTILGAAADAQKTGGCISAQYDSTATYKKGDIVLYNGILHKCIVDITTPEIWTGGHWEDIHTGQELTRLINIDNENERYIDTLINGVGNPIYENISIDLVDDEKYQGPTGSTSAFTGMDLVSFTVQENTRYYIKTVYGYSNAWGINYFNGGTFISADVHPNGPSLKVFSGEIITPEHCDTIRLCRLHDPNGTYPICYVQKIDALSKNTILKDISDSLTWTDDGVRNRENETLVAAQGLRTTIFTVKPGEKYYIIGTRYYNYWPYTILNNRNNIVTYGNVANSVSYGLFNVTIPHDGCKMIVNGVMNFGSGHITANIFTKGFIPAKVYQIDENNITKHTKQQKITFLGDSLTAADTLGGTWGNEPNYTDFVGDVLGLTISNKAVGGSGYRARHGEGYAFYDVASTIDTDTDIVTIFGSWNDGTSNIGTIGNLDPDTMYGAIELTIINLISRVPNARIGIICPTPWAIINPYNAIGNSAAYIKALKDVAFKYSLPVLDLFEACNLRPWDSTFKATWYRAADGTHPSSEAHRVFIAPKVIEFVKTLMQQN